MVFHEIFESLVVLTYHNEQPEVNASQETTSKLATYDASTLALSLRLSVGLSGEKEGGEGETCRAYGSLFIFLSVGWCFDKRLQGDGGYLIISIPLYAAMLRYCPAHALLLSPRFLKSRYNWPRTPCSC